MTPQEMQWLKDRVREAHEYFATIDIAASLAARDVIKKEAKDAKNNSDD
jgi:hypothetical protein